MAHSTKAALIMELHALGKIPREIAWEVYGDTSDKRQAYVRVVLRQRKGRTSAVDARYLCKKFGARSLKEAWRKQNHVRYADPVLYARHREANRACARRRRIANQPT